MGRRKVNHWLASAFLLLFSLKCITSATVKDVFSPDSPLTRLPRESTYSSNNRYGSAAPSDKSIQPEEAPEARRDPQNVGKRCIRCDSGYSDRSSPYDRYKYEDRGRTYDRYDDRDRYSDRYSDRYDRERYPDRDRYYDRYERYPDRSRYPDEDRYSERDRYGSSSDRYDRYRDRYGGSGGSSGSGGSDRYSPYENRDRYDRYDRYERYPERGSGYDNRGYDYKEGYRPWDETYRGTSGFDSSGRGYYFASGRPDYGATSGYGSYGGGGYASGWNYGSSGGGRDDYRDRGYGGGSSSNRYNREPYDGYRTTSYLYGRPSTTTSKPPSDAGSSNTQSPQDNSG